MNSVSTATSAFTASNTTSTSTTSLKTNIAPITATTNNDQQQSMNITSSSSSSVPTSTGTSSNDDKLNNQPHQQQQQQKSQKPILMCFICKLSFGNIKSFSQHANTDHQLNLNESEQLLLCREYSSAIIQKNNDDNSQISFLEPLELAKSWNMAFSSSSSSHPNEMNSNSVNNNFNHDNNNDSNNNSNSTTSEVERHHDVVCGSGNTDDNNKVTTKSSSALNQDNKTKSTTQTNDNKLTDSNPKLTPKSLSVLTSGLADFSNLLEQTNTLNDYLNQHQPRFACPEHMDALNLHEIDCKNCEFININQQSGSSPTHLHCNTTTKSPGNLSPLKGFNSVMSSNNQDNMEMSLNLSNTSSTSSSTSSPIISSVTPNSALLHQQSMQNQSNINTSPSFTIGACPDHMNGRPIGVDCAR